MVSVVRGPTVRALRAACLTGTVAAGVLTAGASGAAAATFSLRAASSTVWLCNPDQAADPCTTGRAATAVTGQGATSASFAPTAPTASRFDCFYVYPTVSTEPGVNADLTVQTAERAAAVV